MVWSALYTALIFIMSAALPATGFAEQLKPLKDTTAKNTQPTDKSCFIEGIDAYQKKEYGTAVRKLKLLLKLHPDTPLRALTHYMLSQSYYRIGNLNAASRYMQIILKEYPDFALKGFINQQQQELLKNSDSALLSETKDKTDNAPYITEGSDSSSSDIIDTAEPDKETSTPLQNLDEILREHPNATFNELILLRISQLYLSAGNLPEAARYFNKLSIESPAFPLKSFFSREQLALLNLDYPLPVGNIATFTPRDLPLPPPDNKQKPDNPSGVKPAAALSLRDVIVGDASIEIVMEGKINGYKSFLQNLPERLVIDIPGAKNRMKVESISVNRYGIEKIRIGFHPKSIRIVLDAALPQFPPNEILLTDKGIKIVFTESPPK